MAKIEEQILDGDVTATDPLVDTPPVKSGLNFETLGKLAPAGTKPSLSVEQQGQFQGIDSHYDKGLEYGDDQQEVRYQNQTTGDLWAAAGTRIASELTLGTLSATGQMLDVEGWYELATGSEEAAGNWFSNIMDDLKKDVEESSPIHMSAEDQGFNPSSGAWWAQNSGSMASALSMLIPTTGAMKGIGYMAKLINATGRGRKAMQAMKLTQKGVRGVAKGLVAASISRATESAMEATETYKGMMQDLTRPVDQGGKGMSQEEANKVAADAAHKTYIANLPMIAMDVLQYGKMYKSFSGARRAITKVAAENATKKALRGQIGTALKATGKFAAMDMGSEGLEEAYQYGVSKDAQYQAEHGLSDSTYLSMDFFGRFLDYMGDDEAKTSAFFGALGGGMFSGAGSAAGHFKDKKHRQHMAKIKDLQTSAQAEVLGDAKKFESSSNDLFIAHAVESAYSGTYNTFENAFTEIANVSDEDLQADGIENIPEYRKTVERRLKDMKYIEKLHEQINGDVSIEQALKKPLLYAKANKYIYANNKKELKAKFKEELQKYSDEQVDISSEYGALMTKAMEAYTSGNMAKFNKVAEQLIENDSEINSKEDLIAELKESESYDALLGHKVGEAIQDVQIKKAIDVIELSKTEEGRAKLREAEAKRQAVAEKLDEDAEFNKEVDSINSEDLVAKEATEGTEAEDTVGNFQALVTKHKDNPEKLGKLINKAAELTGKTVDEIAKEYGIKVDDNLQAAVEEREEVTNIHEDDKKHYRTQFLDRDFDAVTLEGEVYPVTDLAAGKIYTTSGKDKRDFKSYNYGDIAKGINGKAYMVIKTEKDKNGEWKLKVKSYDLAKDKPNGKERFIDFEDLSNLVVRAGTKDWSVTRQTSDAFKTKEAKKSQDIDINNAKALGAVKFWNGEYENFKGKKFEKDTVPVEMANPLGVDFAAAAEPLVVGVNDSVTIELRSVDFGTGTEEDAIVMVDYKGRVLGSPVSSRGKNKEMFDITMAHLKTVGSFKATIKNKNGTKAELGGTKVSLDALRGMAHMPNDELTFAIKRPGQEIEGITESGEEYFPNFSDATKATVEMLSTGTKKGNWAGKTVMIVKSPSGKDIYLQLFDSQASEAQYNGKSVSDHMMDIIGEQEQKLDAKFRESMEQSWNSVDDKSKYYEGLDKNSETVDQEAFEKFYNTQGIELVKKFSNRNPLWEDFKDFKNNELATFVREVNNDKESPNYLAYALTFEEGRVQVKVTHRVTNRMVPVYGEAVRDVLGGRLVSNNFAKFAEDANYRENVIKGGWLKSAEFANGKMFTDINITIEADAIKDTSLEVKENKFKKGSAVKAARKKLQASIDKEVSARQEALFESLYDLRDKGYEEVAMKKAQTKQRTDLTAKAKKFHTGKGDKGIGLDIADYEKIEWEEIKSKTSDKQWEEAEKLYHKNGMHKGLPEDAKPNEAAMSMILNTLIFRNKLEHYLNTSTKGGANPYANLSKLSTMEEVEALYQVGDEVMANALVDGKMKKVPHTITKIYIHKNKVVFNVAKKGTTKDTLVLPQFVDPINPRVEVKEEVKEVAKAAPVVAEGTTEVPEVRGDYKTIHRKSTEAEIRAIYAVGDTVMHGALIGGKITPVEHTIEKIYLNKKGIVVFDAKVLSTGEVKLVAPLAVTPIDGKQVAPTIKREEPTPAPKDTTTTVSSHKPGTGIKIKGKGFSAVSEYGYFVSQEGDVVTYVTIESPTTKKEYKTTKVDTITPTNTNLEEADYNSYVSELNGDQEIGAVEYPAGTMVDLKSGMSVEIVKLVGDNYTVQFGSNILEMPASEVVGPSAVPNSDTLRFRLTDTVPDKTVGEDEITWLKKVLPNVPLETLENVQAMQERFGKAAFGVFHNGIITMISQAAKGTIHHEAFHAVFNMYLTEQEQDSLYDEVRTVNPGSTNMMEEYMAEEFRKYMTKRKPNMLTRLMKFFKSLLHIGKARNMTDMLAVFEKLETGGYATSELQSFDKSIKSSKLASDKSIGTYENYMNSLDDSSRMKVKRMIQDNELTIKCK